MARVMKESQKGDGRGFAERMSERHIEGSNGEGHGKSRRRGMV